MVMKALMSDHIINAPHHLSVLITVVFNAMIIHGMSPESILIGTMNPIPKSKRQVICKSDTFRSITLSSMFTKVLDWVILIKEQAVVCALSSSLVLSLVSLGLIVQWLFRRQ